jgi:sugar (pentulose or hexulose) kinase
VPVPDGLVVSSGAGGEWLLEGGLSAAGSLLEWLGRLTGTAPAELARLAAGRPPGARGVVVLPWLDGARAPWWRDDARGAVVGLSSAHDADDVARAVFEAVAYDVQRCLRAMAPCAGTAQELALGGAGTSIPAWSAILTAVTGLPACSRRSGEAASAGAALLGARATGDPRTLDDLDPPAHRVEPDAAAVEHYREQWERVERMASAVLDLEAAPAPEAPQTAP